MKKKVDPRVRALIEACVGTNHRSLFVIVGDKGRHQVVNLHYILSKATVKARPSVLWCYKRELGFSSHKQKRMKQLKKMAFRAGTEVEKMQEDPFELFISSTKIRYCYYSETHKVLGNTFGMCILQDFEALTPNLLARTIETVEGGGVIVLLLKTMTSLKQLYSLSMDVHARFRTDAHSHVTARFNERFILSLGACKNALVVDDELNVLPISSSSRAMLSSAQQAPEATEKATHQQELSELVKSLQDSPPMGALVGLAKTVDQAKAVLSFMEAVSEKSLRSTVALTAGRGRGKSAALGISIAAAVAYGYSNIFVTSPSPENLQTLFEFVVKAFDALEYKEHLDYQLVQSTNPSFNHCIVRINVFHSHRQTIQYVQPDHAEYLSQAELVVVDEAAAIPLPLVKKLMGPYLLFLSSTINGYEGTGRSLSLKLIQQLREQQAKGSGGGGGGSAAIGGEANGAGGGKGGEGGEKGVATGGRVLREIKLEVPIRYSSGDQVEGWLHSLLCLDCTDAVPPLRGGCPAPGECELYWVNRDTLFSFHKAAEDFLQGMMSLYVASHYKNSPNDLQLLSDAPAHQIFVLLGPVELNSTATPDILCVLQVCLEGQLSREAVLSQLARGVRASGDLIPWTISQQFQDPSFASLSGARVVRIATHPQVTKMGYGSRALDLLTEYFQGKLSSIDEVPAPLPAKRKKGGKGGGGQEGGSVSAPGGGEAEGGGGLLEEKIGGRKELEPLLVPAGEVAPEHRAELDYLGVSYGLTAELHRFWRRSLFQCVYVRQTASDLTGEHTCICIRQLRGEEERGGWLGAFEADFKRRFSSLLGFEFREFSPALPLAILEAKHVSSGGAEGRGEEADADKKEGALTVEELNMLLTHYDLKRLDSYANNLVDHHIINDLVPTLGRLYFMNKLPVALSFTQAAVLLGVGLQHRTIDSLAAALRLEPRQLLANLNKAMVRLSKFLRGLREEEAESQLPSKRKVEAAPLGRSLGEQLDEDAAKAAKKQREAAEARAGGGKGVLGDDDDEEEEYEVAGDDAEWEAALGKHKGGIPSVISLPKKKKRATDPGPGAQRDPRDVDPPSEGKRKGKHFKGKKSPK